MQYLYDGRSPGQARVVPGQTVNRRTGRCNPAATFHDFGDTGHN